jgi:hypothetical protein
MHVIVQMLSESIRAHLKLSVYLMHLIVQNALSFRCTTGMRGRRTDQDMVPSLFDTSGVTAEAT